MQFVLNGVTHSLDAQTVIGRARRALPEPVRAHAVRIEGVAFPVKQAFELASRINRSQFTSHTAIRHLAALGFEIISLSGPSGGAGVVTTTGPTASAGQQWPWEGAVQAVFVNLCDTMDG